MNRTLFSSLVVNAVHGQLRGKNQKGHPPEHPSNRQTQHFVLRTRHSPTFCLAAAGLPHLDTLRVHPETSLASGFLP